MLKGFLNRFNPAGAEPVPESSVLYVVKDGEYLVPPSELAKGTGVGDRATITFEAGKTYRLRFVNSEFSPLDPLFFPPTRRTELSFQCRRLPCFRSGSTDTRWRSSKLMECVFLSLDVYLNPSRADSVFLLRFSSDRSGSLRCGRPPHRRRSKILRSRESEK